VGVVKSFALGSFTDTHDLGPWQVIVDWGDNSTNSVFNATAVGAMPGQSHTYTEAGAYDVLVTVSDGALSASTGFQVLVNPAPSGAPIVTPPVDQTATAGVSKNIVLGSFADANDPGPWKVSVDWGDNAPDSVFNATAVGNLPEQAHTYAVTGSYEVLVTVSDGELAASAGFHVTVSPGEQEAGSVAGKVFADANGNGQQEEGESAISEALVTLSNDASIVSVTLVRTTTTDSDGRFRFDNVPPGNYMLSIEPPPGFTLIGPSHQSVTVTTGSTTNAPAFIVQPNESNRTLYLPALSR
jgi:hypothetical protein